MTNRLKSLSITDFRSIRGTVEVSLDAPVVLIHGQNGAGKTSLLSAIELALTGQVQSLQRVDSEYETHLIHKEAENAVVQLTCSVDGNVELNGRATIDRHGIVASPALSLPRSKFFSERCFLAQATLGRLLELYEDKDTRKTDSPLTKFVKDLLGLDHLDALIEGLHDAGDVRRFRLAVPRYWEVREDIPSLEKRSLERERERAIVQEQLAKERQALETDLRELSLPPNLSAALEDVARSIDQVSASNELQRLAGIRRELSSAREQWKSLGPITAPFEIKGLETRAQMAEADLEKWKQGPGLMVEALRARILESLPDVDAPLAMQAWHLAWYPIVARELDDCSKSLARITESEVRIAQLSDEVNRSKARDVALEQQALTIAVDAGKLARALSDLLPHVHSDECPVCARSFEEVSQMPLHAFVSGRVAALTENASRLQEISKERASAGVMREPLEREIAALTARRPSQSELSVLKKREALLKELKAGLEQHKEIADQGVDLTGQALAAARRLSEVRQADQLGKAIRELVARLGAQLFLPGLAESEPLDGALRRYEDHLARTEESLLSRHRRGMGALERIRTLTDLQSRATSHQLEIQEYAARLIAMKKGKEAADQVIENAKDLAKLALNIRTDIVRRVFNESLNAVWRDLFVRLAPEEPFVPAFSLPEVGSGAVEAVLETHYRRGGKGGNPRSMLSAGNLNTAALTLFLALHLSVKGDLRWLVIDDPVQSMDEVHIAQFAALLRTLSKQHNRQIIVAVHEKPLFDYLSLELSPAFPDDRLITVDLSRSATGATVLKYEHVVWQPESILAVA